MKTQVMMTAFSTLILFASQFSQAAVIHLGATDGTRIDVGYDLREVHVDNGDLSNYTAQYVDGLALTMSNFGSSSTAVITVSCRSGMQYSLSCRPDHTGWIHVNNGCDLNANHYTRRYLGDDFAKLRTRKSGHGLYETCRFELSVVRDGQWLVDPVNGAHNFSLMF